MNVLYQKSEAIEILEEYTRNKLGLTKAIDMQIDIVSDDTPRPSLNSDVMLKEDSELRKLYE